MIINIHRSLPAIAGLLTLLVLAPAPALPQDSLPGPAGVRPAARFGALPMSFEPNQGQADPNVRFVSRGRGYSLALLPDGAMAGFHRSDKEAAGQLSVRFERANRQVEVEGVDRLPGYSNYLTGADPARWKTHVPQYSRVRYRGVYPGIDLIYYGKEGRLEYDFVVAPGADPKAIRLRFDGYSEMKLDRNGDLVFATPAGEFRHLRPVAYQEIDGRRKEVAAQFSRQGRRVTFVIGQYDRTRPLVVDPPLNFSTFMGGSKGDIGAGIAVDSQGYIYAVGTTSSGNFPTQAPRQTTNRGSSDVFVAKLNPNGSSAVWSTYLGGSDRDEGTAMALDANGNVYLAGNTVSDDFPAVQNAYRRNRVAWPWRDGFVACLSTSGTTVLAGTLFGGSLDDRVTGLAIDSTGNFYVSGATYSTNFPTVNPIQNTLKGSVDGFVTKVSANTSALLYSTYLGGSAEDYAWGIAVDTLGSAYVTGDTQSTDFPTVNPFQGQKSGNRDAFVSKLNPQGTGFVYSTFLGSGSSDQGFAIAVDSTFHAFVTGETGSAQFPTAGAVQGNFGGFSDIFVTRFNPQGSALIYSTFIGGTLTDSGRAIAIDASGQAFVTGYSWSSNYPLNGPSQNTYGGGFADAVVTQLGASGNAIVFSTYMGGVKDDNNGDAFTGVGGIAVDSGGNIYVTGRSDSEGFPTTAGSLQPVFGGRSFAVGDDNIGDAFVAKFGSTTNPPPVTSGMRFVPLTPCRVADTRNANGTFGGPVMAGGSTRDFPIAQSSCNVPSGAGAYSVNITVVPRGGLGYLSVWPTGQTQPLVSTLNSFDGRIKANAAIVPAGAGGSISVFVTDLSDVILDINGYFLPATAGANLAFYPVAPCRIADTRNATGTFGGPILTGGQSRSFPIPQSGCGIPVSAQAYSLNVTVVPGGGLGYLSLWPTGGGLPLVSTLNALTGAITANAALVPAGTNGGVSVFVTDSTHVIMDINGYFGPPGGTGALAFYTATPCRIADTRNASGAFGGPVMGGGNTRNFAVTASACGIPGTAQAFSLNATVVPPGALAYLTMWPAGGVTPLVSTLNAFDGTVVANAAIVPGAGGSISAFVTDQTHLILDINGYFAP